MIERAALLATLVVICGNAEAKDLQMKTVKESMEELRGGRVAEAINEVRERIDIEIYMLRPFESEQKCSLNINLDKWGKITGVKPLEKNDFCFSLVGHIWKIDGFNIPLNTEVYNALKSFNIHF